MATKTILNLVSDISGEPITPGEGRSVGFSYDGVDYEVDLTNEEIAALEAALQPYRDVGRRVVGPRRASTAKAAVDQPLDLTAVRAWAASNGITVNPRGRIKSEVIDRFRAAGN